MPETEQHLSPIAVAHVIGCAISGWKALVGYEADVRRVRLSDCRAEHGAIYLPLGITAAAVSRGQVAVNVCGMRPGH